jgi:hypothetical protein|tara:strand:- start:14489 stop:14740 length:252 start_codon:yes stop_codon:yes gene_type:complete
MIIDALNNEIVIGNYYGYSTARNGRNTIHVGTAIRVTPRGMITIKVEYTKTGVYADVTVSESPKTISCKPVLVFPVDITMLKR